jgi:hypothetical protein
VIAAEAAKLGRKPDGHPLDGMSRGRTGGGGMTAEEVVDG